MFWTIAAIVVTMSLWLSVVAFTNEVFENLGHGKAVKAHPHTHTKTINVAIWPEFVSKRIRDTNLAHIYQRLPHVGQHSRDYNNNRPHRRAVIVKLAGCRARKSGQTTTSWEFANGAESLRHMTTSWEPAGGEPGACRDKPAMD